MINPLSHIQQQVNPRRWTGRTRDWSRMNSVWLNPEKQEAKSEKII